MKKLFIALVAIASFASCKKENTVIAPIVSPEPVFSKNLKTISSVYSDGSTELNTFTFDNQGRLHNRKDEDAGTVRILTLDYATAGKVFGVETVNNVLKYNYMATTNDKGYITEIKMIKPGNILYYTMKYTYNANGYVIKYEEIPVAGSTLAIEYKIENGNLTESKNFNNGVQTNTGNYTFDLTKYNPNRLASNGRWGGSSFGKPYKNLLTNSKSTDMNGNVYWNGNSTYQLDAAGYIQKATYTNLLTNKVYTETYTFE